MTVASESFAPPKLDWAGLDLYRFFALVFSPPSPERFGTLAQAALNDALAGLWQQLRCPGDFPGFAWFKRYEEYEATYIAIFDVGIPEPPVPLFESAHDKTRPPQEIALENTWFYDALGLRWDSSCAVPDYLITQLEFLAAVHYTLERAQDDTTRCGLARLETDFLKRHVLNWVHLASTKVNRISPFVFGPLMTLLTAFLQDRRDEVRRAATAHSDPAGNDRSVPVPFAD